VRPYDNTTSTRVDSGIGVAAGRQAGADGGREGISQDSGMRSKRERRRGGGWRSSARWSISRGRLLDLQLHPRGGRFWPFAGIRFQHRLAHFAKIAR